MNDFDPALNRNIQKKSPRTPPNHENTSDGEGALVCPRTTHSLVTIKIVWIAVRSTFLCLGVFRCDLDCIDPG